MSLFKGEAKDVFLGATALKDECFHLVLIITFYNKTSEKKLFSHSSQMG